MGTKTIVCKLETSNRKNERIERCIEEWQEYASHFQDLMAGFDENTRRNEQAPAHYRQIKEGRVLEDKSIYSSTAQQAYKKVVSAYKSGAANGRGGIIRNFGDGDYFRSHPENVNIVENDRGFGVEVGIEPRTDREWFHIVPGEYQYEHLEEVVNGDARSGSAEFHLEDDGELFMHLSVTKETEAPPMEDMERYLGVDWGEQNAYVAVVVEDGEVEDVEFASGEDFRATRDRLSDAQSRAQSQGKQDRIEDQRRRYTDTRTKQFVRDIVSLAQEHEPCGIRFEDLAGMRSQLEDPIHDWPYHEMMTKLEFKAEEFEIPIEAVDRWNTSQTCNKCGSLGDYSGHEFYCVDCDYEVNGDFNAAVNIARGGFR